MAVKQPFGMRAHSMRPCRNASIRSILRMGRRQNKWVDAEDRRTNKGIEIESNAVSPEGKSST